MGGIEETKDEEGGMLFVLLPIYHNIISSLISKKGLNKQEKE